MDAGNHNQGGSARQSKAIGDDGQQLSHSAIFVEVTVVHNVRFPPIADIDAARSCVIFGVSDRLEL